MKIKVKDAGDTKILEVTGRFIFGTESSLAEEVSGLVDLGCRKLVVNLEKIDRIDSSAIGALIQCKKLIEAGGGKVALVKPTKQIALRPLWETLMLEYFDAYDGELAAVGSI